MLKLISLFFIGVFIISCGGEVGRVYHNGTPPTGSTGNTGNPSTKNPIIAKLECLPGTSCNKNQPPIKTNKSNTCLPGVECNPLDTSTDADTNKSTKTDTKTGDSPNNKKKGCLPGQTSC